MPNCSLRWWPIRSWVPLLPELAVSVSCVGQLPGRGKRGGYRVIYYVRRPKGVIWMLTMYAKNVAESIPAHVLRQIREELGDE